MKRPKITYSHSPSSSSRVTDSFDPKSAVSLEYDINNLQANREKLEIDQIVRDEEAATKQSMLDQLYFTKIDDRLTALTAAQGSSCRWSLTKSKGMDWDRVGRKQHEYGGFLWIKGNSGTGKSTLMKLLVEETKLDAQSIPNQIVLSFSFLCGVLSSRNHQSILMVCTSLPHQLFYRGHKLKESLEWITADGAKGIQTEWME